MVRLDLEHPLARGALALAAVAACTLVNFAFQPLTQGVAPFLVYLLALWFTAYHAGPGSALLALTTSALLASYFWLEPVGSLAVANPSQQFALGGYLAIGAVTIHLGLDARRTVEKSHVLAQALGASEERMRGAVEIAQLGVYEWDADGDVFRGDARYRALWGFAPDAPLSLALHEAAIHPDDRPERHAAKARSLDPAGDGAFEAEYRVRGYDGCERRIVSRGRVLFRGRTPHRYAGVVRDVTAERTAAEALRRSEERFRVALDNSLVPFTILTAVRDGHGAVEDFEWTYVNPAAGHALKRAPDALLGRRLLAVLPGNRSASGLFDAYVSVVETGVPHSLEIPYDAEGIRGTFLNVCSRLGDGVAVWFMDITERRQAMEAIARQREELQTMLELLPVGVAVSHDPEGRRITVSRRLAEILGVPEGDMVSLAGLAGAAPPYRFVRDGRPLASHELPMQVVSRTGHEVSQTEYEIQRADGEVRHVLSSAAPLFDTEGRVRGSIAAHVDVTALKRIQRELETADRQKDEFLATLAHELRNPMAPIRYAAALLRPGLSLEVLEQVRGILERQSAQMARLLDDLLDISRITRNVIELQREPLDLAEIIRQAVETARPAVTANRHRLVTSMPAEPFWVRGDAARLAQVIGNLLTNAVKYTPAGGRIEVSLDARGPSAVVQVKDTGVGLSAAMLPRVFELFAQLHRDLPQSQGGLGIGLAVVKRLVELHGGKVRVQSEGLGRGACFSIELRLIQAPQPEAGTEGSTIVPLFGDQPRVLVVDDNEDAADTLAAVLRLAGCPVHVAHRGRTAIDLAEEVRPDVVVLDLGLPDLPGEDVARALRLLPAGRGTLIIAVTGWGQEEDRRRTREAGVDLHLVKPVDADELLRAIGEARGQPVGGAAQRNLRG